MPPACGNAQGTSTSTFTGGASTGEVGVAVQRFTAPLAQGLWLDRLHGFFPTSVPVRLANITSSSNDSSSHPVYVTIDSRRLNSTEGVWVGSMAAPQASARQLSSPGDYTFTAGDASPVGWMWHGGIGYIVAAPATAGATLRVTLNPAATGSWGSIGQNGAYGNATGPLITIWQEFTSPAAGDLAEVRQQQRVIGLCHTSNRFPFPCST